MLVIPMITAALVSVSATAAPRGSGAAAFVGVMLVCAGVSAAVVTRARKRLSRRYREQPSTGPRYGLKMTKGTLETIRRGDPGFEAEAFLRRAQATFWLVQSAFERGGAEAARAYVTPELFQEWRVKAARTDGGARTAWRPVKVLFRDDRLGMEARLNSATRAAAGRRWALENLRLLDVNHGPAYLSSGHTLGVRFHMAYTTWICDAQSVRGARPRVHETTELWLFYRDAGVQTTGTDGVASGQCPNCHRRLQLDGQGHCGNCAANVTTGAYDWTVTRFRDYPATRTSTAYSGST